MAERDPDGHDEGEGARDTPKILACAYPIPNTFRKSARTLKYRFEM